MGKGKSTKVFVGSDAVVLVKQKVEIVPVDTLKLN